MGVEVKSGGEGVIVADRGCNDGCCCNGRNSGWGSGWGAVGGALVGGGFGAAAVSVWDKINDTKADIQKVESTVQEAKAGIYKDISDAARGVTQEISGVAKDVAGVGREILNNRFTRKEDFVIWDTKPIPISGILVTKWEQASIVLWTVFAIWNMNNSNAAAKLIAILMLFVQKTTRTLVKSLLQFMQKLKQLVL